MTAGFFIKGRYITGDSPKSKRPDAPALLLDRLQKLPGLGFLRTSQVEVSLQGRERLAGIVRPKVELPEAQVGRRVVRLGADGRPRGVPARTAALAFDGLDPMRLRSPGVMKHVQG